MTRTLAFSLALLGFAGAAQAQYYGGRPYYGPPGSQCDAYFRTPYGPRQIVCPMGVAKPVGAPCRCPAPGPYEPPARGHVVP